MDKRKLARHFLAVMPKAPRFSPNDRRVVEVLAYPSVKLLDVTGPIQVFASANAYVAQAGQPMPYTIRVVAKAGERVEASGGVELAAHPLSPTDSVIDTLMIAGGEGVAAAAADRALIDWVRERAKQARRTASVCTGAFLLAASGMLDGRRAVTHWAFCAELARRFPFVKVEPDPIFIQDGNVWTSAGVTAGIDLALALVEEDLGRAVALAVARYLVVFLKRPGGQAQFSEFLSLQAAEDKFGALHDWISDHLADDLSLPVLATQAGMSERSKHARRTASVCTGAFLLAGSGMLDGRRAVTHWAFCAELARRFPNVRVEPEPIFVQDGAIWTSAGVTAGIDLALALVEEDLGRSIALAVARDLVVFLKRPGGQAQFSEFLSLQAAEDKFGALHDWISNHLGHDLSLPVLARQAGMSERSFSRHYAEATGQTPARAIERLRVQGARNLLAETRLPVKRISQRCGFGSEETMRRSFLRLLDTTPQDYRARFSR